MVQPKNIMLGISGGVPLESREITEGDCGHLGGMGPQFFWHHSEENINDFIFRQTVCERGPIVCAETEAQFRGGPELFTEPALGGPEGGLARSRVATA